MRPERHCNEPGSRLGRSGGADEFDVSSVDPIEVADQYDGRPAHSMRLPVLLVATSNS
jgi:hypothetical protein